MAGGGLGWGLMRTAAEHFGNRCNIASANLIRAKDHLSSEVDNDSFRFLKSLVHKLNKQLYSSLKNAKDKKMKDLLPTPISDDDANDLVTTIPNDLELSNVLKLWLRHLKGFKGWKFLISLAHTV